MWNFLYVADFVLATEFLRDLATIATMFRRWLNQFISLVAFRRVMPMFVL